MGIATGVTPLTLLSVTLQWICLLISPACCRLHRTSLKSCREFPSLQTDIRVCVEELVWGKMDCAFERTGTVGHQAWEFMRYLYISGPISGQSECPVRKSNTDQNVLTQEAELDHRRRIWLKCIPLLEQSRDASPPDAGVSACSPTHTAGKVRYKAHAAFWCSRANYYSMLSFTFMCCQYKRAVMKVHLWILMGFNALM